MKTAVPQEGYRSLDPEPYRGAALTEREISER